MKDKLLVEIDRGFEVEMRNEAPERDAVVQQNNKTMAYALVNSDFLINSFVCVWHSDPDTTSFMTPRMDHPDYWTQCILFSVSTPRLFEWTQPGFWPGSWRKMSVSHVCTVRVRVSSPASLSYALMGYDHLGPSSGETRRQTSGLCCWEHS